MTSPLWVYAIGFVGMALYGVRLFVQWYMSEKAHKVVSPGIYWVLSSIGAVILYIYGWLRKDFSIIFGESVGYYIYMWNISIMGLYKKVPRIVVIVQALFPAGHPGTDRKGYSYVYSDFPAEQGRSADVAAVRCPGPVHL